MKLTCPRHGIAHHRDESCPYCQREARIGLPEVSTIAGRTVASIDLPANGSAHQTGILLAAMTDEVARAMASAPAGATLRLTLTVERHE